jgi:hypothetical protein
MSAWYRLNDVTDTAAQQEGKKSCPEHYPTDLNDFWVACQHIHQKPDNRD